MLSSDLKHLLMFSHTTKTNVEKLFKTCHLGGYLTNWAVQIATLCSKILRGNPGNARSPLDSDTFWVTRRHWLGRNRNAL